MDSGHGVDPFASVSHDSDKPGSSDEVRTSAGAQQPGRERSVICCLPPQKGGV